MPEMSEAQEMKIAITGSIGSGKSTVLKILEEKGYKCYSCDKINAELLKYPNKGYELIKIHFKECVNDREVDRKALSDIVFKDKKALDTLNSLMHPLILDEILKKKDDPLFVEVPLLYESGFDRYFDHALLVYTSDEIALERLLDRGLEKEEALRRLDNQMSVEKKLKRADHAIDNSFDLDTLKFSVEKWLKEIL